MDFVFKLVTFIFIVSAVQSNETKSVKNFKLNEKMIYDCVDIYKQPSMSHPLLQNHKIQMEPSFSITKPENKTTKENKNKKIIECPKGTVPILRNTKEYVANAQYWEEKHYNPLTVGSPGTHFDGVRIQEKDGLHGLAAWMSVHDLNVGKDQASYTAIYVIKGVNNKDNSIQTGWMVNPSLFGDGRTWSYGFWKGANGAGCYNTKCPGFVQVSKTDPLSAPLPGKGDRAIHISLQQDNESGHWWTTHVRSFEKDIHVGYWPKELFDVISNGVDTVGVTGAVQASPSGISPPMGNGHLPLRDENAAGVKHLETVNKEFIIQDSNKYKLEKVADDNQCYRLKWGTRIVVKESNLFPFGGGVPGAGSNKNLFTYGGPGGNSCGV